MEIGESWVRVPCQTDFTSQIEKPQRNSECHLSIYIYISIYTRFVGSSISFLGSLFFPGSLFWTDGIIKCGRCLAGGRGC